MIDKIVKEIELTEEGRAEIIINIKPFDELELRNVKFKLDTGADITTINKNELKVLGYGKEWISNNMSKHPALTITRAGSKNEPAYYVQIPKCNILGRDLFNWPIYIRPETDKDFPNLLGIDILHNFDFDFRYSSGILAIWPINESYIKIPMLASQEIFAVKSSS